MNLAGPQSDRDLHWRKGPTAKAAPPSEEAFDSENSRLRSENNLLKDQLQRSLKELKQYQLKYPSPYAAQLQADSAHDDSNPSLTASPEITSALLSAYDTRIYELEETIKQLMAQNDSIKDSAAAVITENEQLRVLNLQGVRSSVNDSASSGAGMRLDPNAPLNSEVLADLQEQLDVLRGENNLLIEQRSVLLSELESHQAELERKSEEMAQQAQQLFAAVSDVQALSKRVEQATQDRDAAAAQALSYSDILGKTEVDQEALTEQVAGLTQRCREAEGLVQEYKRQLRSLSTQGEVESVTSTKRVQDAENRVRELHGVVHAKTRELDQLNEVLRKVRAEYASTRQDALGMLDVIAAMERQQQEYVARTADVDQREKQSREREAETMTFREQCAARDDQNKREIERLLSERKVVALRRKDEIERAIEGTRALLGEQIAALEKEVDAMAEKNARLIFEAEKAGRDGRSAEELLRRVQRLHEEESKGVQATVRDLAERLEAASRGREQEAARRAELQEQLRDLRTSSEKLRVTIDELRAQLSLAERNHETAQAALKVTVRDLQKELSEKARLLVRRVKEAEDLRATLGEQVAALERRLQEETAQLQRRAAEADRAARDSEAAGFAGDLRTQTAIDQLKEKYGTAVALLESRLRGEADQVKSLSAKIRQSESVICDLLEEKAELARQAEDAQGEARLLEEDLAASRAAVADLAGQLSSSHQAREDGALRAAKLMETLHVGGSPSRASVAESKYEDMY